MIQDTMVMNPPEGTQIDEVSRTKYAWVLLFVMNVDREFPFIIVRLSHFKDSDFPHHHKGS